MMKNFTKSLLISALLLAFGSAIAQPTASAPTPSDYATGKYISIFSDKAGWTNLTGTNFNPNWGQKTVTTQIKIGGTDNVLKYAGLDYQGTNLGGADGVAQNFATMTYLHVDVWTSDETELKFFLISSSNTAVSGGFFWSPPAIVLNSWNSYNIPMTHFSAQFALTDIFQLKVLGSGVNPGQTLKTVYLDNIYLYDTTAPDTQAPTGFTASLGTVSSSDVVLKLSATDNSGAVNYTISYGTTILTTSGVSGTEKSYTVTGLTASTAYSFSITCKDAAGNPAANNPIVVQATTAAAMAAAPTPTIAANKVISIYSDAYTNQTGTDFFPNWGQSTVVTDNPIGGNATKKYTNFNYQGIQLASPVNVSSMTRMHIDIYPTTETAIRLTPINTTATGTKENPTSLGTLTANKWNSFNIVLSIYGVNMSAIDQFKFDGGTGGTFYMDNIYFYNDATGIALVESAPEISCYPNPVVSNLTITAPSEMNEITIRNLMGQSVKSLKLTGTTKTNVDLGNFAAGSYFVTVKLRNGAVSTQKLLKF
jgi:hypothetical protein